MSSDKSKRTRRTREEWQVLIDNFTANPIDPQTYCKQTGVTLARFKIWQRRLDQPGFVEVKPLPVPQSSSVSENEGLAVGSHWDVELSLGADITLRLRTR